MRPKVYSVHDDKVRMNKQEIIEKVKTMMAKVNAECFNNELNLNFPISLSTSGRVAGAVTFQRFGSTYTVLGMKISQCFNWTDSELLNTIAHELIHVYEIQVLKVKPSHGRPFLTKMNEINRLFPSYSVETRHSMKTTKVKKSRPVLFILSKDRQKLSLVNAKYLTEVKNNPRISEIFGEGYSCGLIDSDKVKPYYRVSLKLRSIYRTSPDRLSQIGL